MSMLRRRGWRAAALLAGLCLVVAACDSSNPLGWAGNIVPLANSQKKSDRLKDVLDTVSAKMTTRGLADLNASVSGNSGIDPDQVARNVLRYNGFDHPILSWGAA
jgi:osmoprotectant transport system substrate-binding protein